MLRKHKFVKVLLIGLLIYLVITIIPQLANCACAASKTPPSVEKAPYLVTTASRIYYAESASMAKDKVVMMNYYSLRDGRWSLVRKRQDLPFSIFGQVSVTRRTSPKE